MSKTQPEATAGFIVSKVTPDLIKYAWQCANEREHASIQKLSCADVRGLLAEHAALVGALVKIEAIVKDGVIHRHETGKPQWSAFDEIKKIVAAIKGGK